MAEEEDDFGEFGGFEAAEPGLDDVVPQNVEAIPSPWALFPAGTAAPDLIQAQGRMHPQLEPPFPLDEVSTAANGQSSNNNASLPHDNGGYIMENDLLASSSNAQAAISHEDILELGHGSGSSNSSRGASAACNHPVVQQLPDIQSLDRTAQSPQVAPDVELDVPPLELPVLNNHAPVNEMPPLPNAIGGAPAQVHAPPLNVGPAAQMEVACEDRNAVELNDNLSLVEQEKEKIQRDLNELLARHEEIVEEFKVTKLHLAEQREKYKTLQEKHEKDLDDVRRAGHDALVVIVEEYKALCRTAILEQQDTMEKHMHECLKTERQKFEEALESQRERLVQSIEEERSKNGEDMKKMREELQERHQSELQTFLQKEQERQAEVLSIAVREEQEASKKLLEGAVEEERVKSNAKVQEEREASRTFIAEEQEKFSKMIQDALEKERLQSKEAIANCIKTERQHSKDLSQEVIEKAREEMRGYVTENRQADATVRRKQLASLDLFLEGARHQLSDLMSKTSEENG